MKIDLKPLSIAELNDLKKSIAVELELRQHGERQKLLDEFREKAKAVGMSLEELMGSGKGRIKKPRGVAKYANPADRSQTWTGKGKRPRWVHEALAAGKSLSDLLI